MVEGVRLADLENNLEGEQTHFWNATVDGKSWGCPVVGSFVETKDGKIKVHLAGWGLFPPKVKGKTLSAEIGNRRIAVVDTGRVDQDGKPDQSGIAYVALFVGPAVPETKHANPDMGLLGPDIKDVIESYAELELMTPEPVFVDPEIAKRCIGPTKEMIDNARLEIGPHANCVVKIFMNQLASKAFNDRAEYPVGSIVVKEKTTLKIADETNTEGRGTELGIGGMIKRAEGFDESNGNWEYFYEENGADVEVGKISSCIQCHATAKGSDYVFGDWAKNDQDGDPYGNYETPNGETAKREPQTQKEPYFGRCVWPLPPEFFASLLDDVVDGQSDNVTQSLVRHGEPTTQPATERTAWVCIFDGRPLWVVNNELGNLASPKFRPSMEMPAMNAPRQLIGLKTKCTAMLTDRLRWLFASL